MADIPPPGPSPGPSLGERLRDIRLIEQALVRAVREALLRHKQAGNPIAAWRDGRVVWIAPEDIPVTEDDLIISKHQSTSS